MVKTFTEEFRARYQEEPTALAAQGYDAVLLCAAVLKTGVKTRLEFRDSLLQVRNFQGITGPATMDADGDAETVPYLFTIRGGQVQQLPAGLLPQTSPADRHALPLSALISWDLRPQTGNGLAPVCTRSVRQ